MRSFPAHLQKDFPVFKKLGSPSKIQDFLDAIPGVPKHGPDTCASPLAVLAANRANCIEGALIAAAALWCHGKKPLLLDLKTATGAGDSDHVVALFRKNGHWGALSKTNHAVLRYRDPVYRSVRELAMSYFNEYFLDSGKKTLQSFSRPFSLLSFDDEWLTSPENLWGIAEALDDSPHHAIVTAAMKKSLRPAHPLEIAAGKIVEWEGK